MRAENIIRRPGLATGILVAGIVAFWLLCRPAMRGSYPTLDPFWRVMPWLWFFPVLISAVYDDHRRRRLLTLVVFGLATGCVGARVWGFRLIAGDSSATEVFVRAAFWVPLCLVATVLLELAWQRVLRGFRCLIDDDKCQQCGYLIRYLTVARCPECGTEFDEKWLTAESDSITPTSRPWRTNGIVASLVLVCVMMPPLYRWGALAYTRHLAREAARSDLASGNGALYISYSQLKSIFFRASFPPVDPLTGLLIRDALHGTEGKLHMEAYNTTIENELAKQGTYPITRYLLNRKQMARLVNTAPFVDTDELPLSIGRNLLIDLQDGNVMLNGRRIYQPPKKYAVVDEPPGLVIVMRDNQVWTVLPDGSPVQRAYLRKEFGAWTVPPQPSHLMPAP